MFARGTDMSELRPDNYIPLKFDLVTTRRDGAVNTTAFPGGMEGEALSTEAWLNATKDPQTEKTKIIVTGQAVYRNWPPYVDPK
jgi:hypothetical protein